MHIIGIKCTQQKNKKSSTCRVQMGYGKYNFIHKISNTSCALK